MTELKALIYARVSSDKQMNEGSGLDSQEHRCRQYASEKGYAVEKVFKDHFSGGGDFMKRPAMAELLGYIDKHPHQKYVVIFDDLKRFARDKKFHWDLKAAFKSRDTTVECLNFRFEDSPEGEFVEAVFAAQADLERQQNKRQVIQKQKARLERGYWPFFHPPGYRQVRNSTDGKLLMQYEPEASIITEALEGYADNRFPQQVDVQVFLQSKNFCGKGRRVHLEKVKRLLERPIYAGYIEYPDWEVSRRKGQHEALISEEVYQRVQDKLSGKARVITRKDTSADFPLRGLICCPECKKRYTASWTRGGSGKKFPYYRCKTKGCPLKEKSIPQDRVHSDFLSLLKTIKPKSSLMNLTKVILKEQWNKFYADSDTKRKRLKRLINDTQSEIGALIDRITKTTTEATIRAYEEKINVLSKEKAKLEESLEKLEQRKYDFETALDMLFSYLKDPYTAWIKGDLAQKRLILNITFKPDIAYDKNTGFETGKLCLILRVFKQFDASKPQDVELGGVEPPCKRCSPRNLRV
jgi:site-specific DNA recombinase